MNATQAIVEVLGVSIEQAETIQKMHDTTFDGSKWSDASFNQIIITAIYVNKAIEKAVA